MAQIVVRGIDDQLMKAFKARAKAEGKSAEQAVRDLIEQAAQEHERRDVWFERINAFREEQMQKYGAFETSAVDLIREDRDSR